MAILQDTDVAPVQAGSITVTFDGVTAFQTVAVTWPHAYSAIPTVLAIANTVDFVASVDAVTALGCNVRIATGAGNNPANNTVVTAQWLTWGSPGS